MIGGPGAPSQPPGLHSDLMIFMNLGAAAGHEQGADTIRRMPASLPAGTHHGSSGESIDRFFFGARESS